MAKSKIGLWLIGAGGGVACTSILGLCALRKRLAPAWGLVSELERFHHLELPAWEDFVVGGHEIRPVRLVDEVLRLATESRAIESSLISQCRAELERIDRRLRPGVAWNVGATIASLAGPDVPQHEPPADAIERVQNDLKEFARQNDVEHVIVVNVASTEPPVDDASLPSRWLDLQRLLRRPRRCPLRASSLYAIAALDLSCSYINFTPSLGSVPPAIHELALLRKTRHMGRDGKTGETLLKSVLAPMFARRNLRVMSWVGHNIFGNMDGQVLADPANKQAKVASKDHLLREILGYRPQTHVSIEYIESLGDWKTAWDHVHFQGFLGTPMTFQFIWQGCDSLLAAPLVLDLARFAALAWRRGETGRLTFLASFFKSPDGVEEHDFTRQFQMLEAWAGTCSPLG